MRARTEGYDRALRPRAPLVGSRAWRSRVHAGLVVACIAASFGCRRGSEASSHDDAAGAEVAPGDAVAGLGASASAEPQLPDVPPPVDLGTPPDSAVRAHSGMASRVLRAGTGGVPPRGYDRVRVRYVGWTKDGRVRAASSPSAENPPITLRIDECPVGGLAEGLKLMVEGEKRRFWIPASLTSDQDLVLDVELVEVVPTPRPPPVPDDASLPPKSARHTSSGMRWRSISPSSQKNAKKATSDHIAVYNLTVWKTSGELFESSFPQGQPEVARIAELPRPWGEALQLMRVGDRIRIWFAEDQGGPPGGPYVADVELLYLYSLPSGR